MADERCTHPGCEFDDGHLDRHPHGEPVGVPVDLILSPAVVRAVYDSQGLGSEEFIERILRTAVDAALTQENQR